MRAASSSTSLTWVQFWIFFALLANFRVEWVSSPYLYIKIIDVLSSQHEKMQCLQAGSGDRAQDGRATVASERWFENSGELGVTIGNVLSRFALGKL
jgi:hypothetical protein